MTTEELYLEIRNFKTSFNDTCNTIFSNQSSLNDALSNLLFQLPSLVSSAVDGTFEDRLKYLENLIQSLKLSYDAIINNEYDKGTTPVQLYTQTNKSNLNGNIIEPIVPNGLTFLDLKENPPYKVNNSDNWYLYDSQIPLNEKGQFTWVLYGTYNENYPNKSIIWNSPIRITPEDGSDGEDGFAREYIYKLTSELIAPDLPISDPDKSEDFLIEIGDDWVKDAVDAIPTENKRYCWFAWRDKLQNGKWDVYKGPSLWSTFGLNGKDGDGVEWIFHTCSEEEYQKFILDGIIDDSEGFDELDWVKNLNNNLSHSSWQQNEVSNIIGFGWTDDAQNPDKDVPYVFASFRKKTANEKGIGIWGQFTRPFYWSRWAEDGKDGKDIEYIFAPIDEKTYNDWDDDISEDLKRQLNEAYNKISNRQELNEIISELQDVEFKITLSDESFRYITWLDDSPGIKNNFAVLKTHRDKIDGVWREFVNITVCEAKGPQGENGEANGQLLIQPSNIILSYDENNELKSSDKNKTFNLLYIKGDLPKKLFAVNNISTSNNYYFDSEVFYLGPFENNIITIPNNPFIQDKLPHNDEDNCYKLDVDQYNILLKLSSSCWDTISNSPNEINLNLYKPIESFIEYTNNEIFVDNPDKFIKTTYTLPIIKLTPGEITGEISNPINILFEDDLITCETTSEGVITRQTLTLTIRMFKGHTAIECVLVGSNINIQNNIRVANKLIEKDPDNLIYELSILVMPGANIKPGRTYNVSLTLLPVDALSGGTFTKNFKIIGSVGKQYSLKELEPGYISCTGGTGNSDREDWNPTLTSPNHNDNLPYPRASYKILDLDGSNYAFGLSNHGINNSSKLSYYLNSSTNKTEFGYKILIDGVEIDSPLVNSFYAINLYNTVSFAISPKVLQSARQITIQLYRNLNNTYILVDESIIEILVQGAMGIDGAVIRMRGQWKENDYYFNKVIPSSKFPNIDACPYEVIDVVLHNEKYYRLNEVEYINDDKTPDSSDSKWVLFTHYDNIATGILIAENSYAHIAQAGTLVVGDDIPSDRDLTYNEFINTINKSNIIIGVDSNLSSSNAYIKSQTLQKSNPKVPDGYKTDFYTLKDNWKLSGNGEFVITSDKLKVKKKDSNNLALSFDSETGNLIINQTGSDDIPDITYTNNPTINMHNGLIDITGNNDALRIGFKDDNKPTISYYKDKVFLWDLANLDMSVKSSNAQTVTSIGENYGKIYSDNVTFIMLSTNIEDFSNGEYTSKQEDYTTKVESYLETRNVVLENLYKNIKTALNTYPTEAVENIVSQYLSDLKYTNSTYHMNYPFYINYWISDKIYPFITFENLNLENIKSINDIKDKLYHTQCFLIPYNTTVFILNLLHQLETNKLKDKNLDFDYTFICNIARNLNGKESNLLGSFEDQILDYSKGSTSNRTNLQKMTSCCNQSYNFDRYILDQWDIKTLADPTNWN